MAAAPAAFSVRPTATPRTRPCSCSTTAAGGPRFRSDGGNGKWWAPLLGWSGQPDYIDALPAAEEDRPTAQPAPAGPRRVGLLTEEKTRQLRMRTIETESFHHAIYHSPIASRLASAAPDDDTKASS